MYLSHLSRLSSSFLWRPCLSVLSNSPRHCQWMKQTNVNRICVFFCFESNLPVQVGENSLTDPVLHHYLGICSFSFFETAHSATQGVGYSWLRKNPDKSIWNIITENIRWIINLFSLVKISNCLSPNFTKYQLSTCIWHLAKIRGICRPLNIAVT